MENTFFQVMYLQRIYNKFYRKFPFSRPKNDGYFFQRLTYRIRFFVETSEHLIGRQISGKNAKSKYFVFSNLKDFPRTSWANFFEKTIWSFS